MKRPVALSVAALALVALIAAGCGGSSKSSSSNSSTATTSTTGNASNSTGKGYGSTTTSTPANTTAASKSAAVSLASTSAGKALVGPNGHTLYLFEKDKNGMSACSGSCASEWPPLTTSGKPKAGSGVDAAKLTVTKRSDGKSQVVYAGHPLYFYVGDTKTGDANGQGLKAFGAEWYVLAGSGNKIDES
jgi:predicted lipoprotein with Yx(FWY)xxD motif